MRFSRLLVIVLVWPLLMPSQTLMASEFKLATTCPPSFELKANRCLFRNYYQLYASDNDKGVGGTQTNLPPIRDGFTPQQIDLGRYLFFDPILSGNKQLSCASCHQPALGFADGLDRSIGVTGEKVSRAAPSLWNVGFLKRLFWDSRAESLEQQAEGPLFDPKEMGNTPERLMADLRNSQHYQQLFQQAYPTQSSFELTQVVQALTAFQASLVSLNSRYDRYAHGDHQALNANEIAGMNIFRSFVARCAECHTPPLFTNQQVAVIGTPEPDGLPFDVGAEKTFSAFKLKGGFKVPTLRNIAKTAPYMHSGKFSQLRDAVEFYNKGRGHAVPKEQNLYLHWHIWEPQLTDNELDRIVDFLQTLTDETFMPVVPNANPSGLAAFSQSPQANDVINRNGE